MDLNQLLYHHQIALIQGQSCRDELLGSRFDLVRHYRSRIDALRRTLGVSSYPAWCEQELG